MIGTSANLPYGYWIRLIDLLYALMLPSGNDAACLLAEAFGLLMFYEKIKPEENLYENIVSIDLTSYESTANFSNQFIKEMNRKCKMLGLYNTSFTNPHGMTTSVNVSSAKDLLTLSVYCHKNPLFMKIASAK